MAATAKPRLAALKTAAAAAAASPATATYPSEITSPINGSPLSFMGEDLAKTPITPPLAYVDFLKSLSPMLISPAPTSAPSLLPPPPPPPPSRRRGKCILVRPCSSAGLPPTCVAATDPLRARTVSSSSSSSSGPASAIFSSASDHFSFTSTTLSPSSSSSPFARPYCSTHTLWRLQIPPHSPHSPVRSPVSRSPKTPASAKDLVSDDPDMVKTAGRACVSGLRHVVARTTVYSRTPIEPAPKGKRRKIESDQ